MDWKAMLQANLHDGGAICCIRAMALSVFGVTPEEFDAELEAAREIDATLYLITARYGPDVARA